MKKIILLLSLALTVSFVSCSKDDNGKVKGKTTENTEKPNPTTEKTETKEELLIGTWKLIERGEIVDGKEVKHELDECTMKSYMTFEANKKVIRIDYFLATDKSECMEDDYDQIDWDLKDNSVSTFVDGKKLGSLKIIELTKDRLHFEYEDRNKYEIFKK